MATLPERATGSFRSLFAGARRRVVDGGAGVRELHLALDGPPLRARSRLLTSGALTFVRGENQAAHELTLESDGDAPLCAVHVVLRGTAEAIVDGLGVALTRRPGELQLFASPTTRTHVALHARVINEAFRVVFAPRALAALAARHPPLEVVAARAAAGEPYCGPPLAPAPLPRLRDHVA